MDTDKRFDGWENYPVAEPGLLDDAREVQKLIADTALFVEKPSSIRFQAFGAMKFHDVLSLDSLETLLKGDDWNKHALLGRFFFITQRTSWARLQISRDMFKMLCHVYRVFPRYFQSVSNFNRNTCSTYEYLGGGCFRHLSVGPGIDQVKTYEICYNIRKFERHGRDMVDDPWSCRQCSVYQKYQPGIECTWIFIQLPRETKELLDRIFEAGEETLYQMPRSHCLALHLLLLWSCEKNWEEYIGSMGNEIAAINLETAFLNDNYRDYGVKLVHCQDIAHVRWKLENAILLLEAHLDVATTLAEHANSMCIVDDECLTGSPHDRFMSELLQYRCKIECHIRNARKHLRFAGVVNELTLKILDFQNDEIHRGNSDSLKTLASQTVMDSRAMVTIAEKSKSDSRMMAVATLIATIYLPASFVASFFSTDMVQYNAQADGQASAITVRRDVWVYVSVSLALMVCTMVSAYFLSRRMKRWEERAVP